MTTSTATRTRPRTADPRAATPVRGGADACAVPTWRRPLVALLAAAVVGGGTWGLLAPRDSSHPHGPHADALATLDLPDGTLRVDGLVDKQVGHVMAGMSASEDVPVGMRRFSVNVTLGATEDEPLRYTSRDFTVAGPGVAPVVPVISQIDSGSLEPGRSISGSLSFDVPKEASELSLTYEGAAPVALPALPSTANGQHADEHGGAPAAGQAPAAEPPAPAADHHDAPGTPPHDH